MALYNCEIWGSDNIKPLTKYDRNKIYELSENDFHKKIHIKLCKSNLRVKGNSVNIACRAELGRFPLPLEVNKHIIKYHS